MTTNTFAIEGPAEVGIAAGVLIVFFLVVGLAVWQGFRTYQMKLQHRADVARDEAYQKLAAEAVVAQAGIARDLSDLRQRVAAIEKMMREVG